MTVSAHTFISILFEGGDPRGGETIAEPEYFHDLNLDLIVRDITSGRSDYQLDRFFRLRLRDLDAIRYRHEVMRDLEKPELFQACKSFAAQMRRMREGLVAAENRSYPHEKERWVLDAALAYADAVEALHRDLAQGDPASRGLRSFLEYLDEYAWSDGFQALVREAKQCRDALSALRYSLIIHGGSVTVREYRDEADYSAVVEEVFARFRQGAVKDYRVKLPISSGLNHVEAQVLDFVAQLNPEPFRALTEFCGKHRYFCAGTLADFDREIQFYLACLEYAGRFRQAGLACCYPELSDTGKAESAQGCFDMALAGKLVPGRQPVVRNDFSLAGPERILVVTGPNQGGKTTFARTFGQMHHLASLGCPVAGSEVRLFLCDRIFTHFEREEDIATLHGKLQDDLVRMHRILGEATPASVVIVNEIFSSTSLEDAVLLGRKVVERLSQLDLLAVCVTFLDELASQNEKTVSLVAAVEPDNPAARTYRIERRPADGLSHAVAIAEKYRLTYARLKERLKR